MLISICAFNYDKSDLEVLVESLKATGYSGDKVCFYNSVTTSALDYLRDNGWETIRMYDFDDISDLGKRCLYTYEYLEQHTFPQWVLFVDAKDTYFYENPENLTIKPGVLYVGKDVGGSIESQPWARNNMIASFPHLYDSVKDKEHLNIGVVYGTSDVMHYVLKKTWELWKKDMPKHFLPFGKMCREQLAFNIIAHQETDRFELNLTRQIINLGGKRYTPGDKYHIFHQYNRVDNFDFPK